MIHVAHVRRTFGANSMRPCDARLVNHSQWEEHRLILLWMIECWKPGQTHSPLHMLSLSLEEYIFIILPGYTSTRFLVLLSLLISSSQIGGVTIPSSSHLRAVLSFLEKKSLPDRPLERWRQRSFTLPIMSAASTYPHPYPDHNMISSSDEAKGSQ